MHAFATQEPNVSPPPRGGCVLRVIRSAARYSRAIDLRTAVVGRASGVAPAAVALGQSADPELADLNPIGALGSAADTLGVEGGLAAAINIVILLTVLSLVPAILILCTCFTRMVIVFGLLRQALFAERVGWPDQIMIRGTLTDIREKARAEKITRTALILVGPALGDPGAFEDSALYDPEKPHLLRPRARPSDNG